MKKKIFALSIDGGGMRGIIPAKILAEFERRSGKPIAKMFNLIAGTSTGGILALALAVPDEKSATSPKFSASGLIDLYKELGVTVFGEKMLVAPPLPANATFWQRIIALIQPYTEYKYKADGLEAVLKAKLGELRLSDLVTNLLITSYDLNEPGPRLFKSHGVISNSPSNYKLLDVARATSAAPTYFQPKQIWAHKQIL